MCPYAGPYGAELRVRLAEEYQLVGNKQSKEQRVMLGLKSVISNTRTGQYSVPIQLSKVRVEPTVNGLMCSICRCFSAHISDMEVV